jgi:hypothetical protein
MENSSTTSLLTVLSLYTSLRRSGSSERGAQEKLRGLALQLNGGDRKELLKAINDWESKHGKRVEQQRPAKDQYRATLVMSPGAAQVYGESHYDHVSNTSTDTVLKPLRRIVTCPSCGKKNDSAKTTCAYCGNVLEPVEVNDPAQTVADSWFGPDSKLALTINGVTHPVEVPVHGVLTFGRHTPDNDMADFDLTEYRGDVFGVSRLHASLKYQNNALTITDLQSKNHTYVNEYELKDGEIRTLSSGDRIRLGNLGINVTFKHP